MMYVCEAFLLELYYWFSDFCVLLPISSDMLRDLIIPNSDVRWYLEVLFKDKARRLYIYEQLGSCMS